MTEIQIKNLIKEYEKEYIEFMEIEKLPQYKIDFFEINVEESDAAGFASAAQAYYNTKTDEHILRICKSSEIPRYIVFHEFTHILDTEMYAKQDSWKYMALSGHKILDRNTLVDQPCSSKGIMWCLNNHDISLLCHLLDRLGNIGSLADDQTACIHLDRAQL